MAKFTCEEFGIQWDGLIGIPTEKFWRAWRKDSARMRDRGYRVKRQENGEWYVTRPERSAKSRVKDAINRRYARYFRYR